jgi:Flp pilus assembly protein TadG
VTPRLPPATTTSSTPSSTKTITPPSNPAGQSVRKATSRRWRVGPGDDEGRISMFLLVIFMAFMLLTGITTDLGRVLHANARASDLAAKAARAGAQELDPASIRAGADQLDPTAAEQSALAYVNTWRAGNPAGTQVAARADANPAQVSVTVTWPVRFWLLAALRPSATVTQTRTANPATGP